MIVLNEHDWAGEAITNKTLGKNPSETLIRVARYYLDSGYTKRAVRKMLDSFLIQCDPMASLPKWSQTLDFAVKRAAKKETVIIKSITITVPEMEKICSVASVMGRRLAFTLCCLAKYWDISGNGKDHWVNTKDSDIMNLANISASIKRQSILYQTLKEMGLIEFSKKVDNTNVRVCFLEDGDTAMEVTDFRNLGYQFMRYSGGKYLVCECCGITTKYTDPSNPSSVSKQKYCRDCARQMIVKQKVDYAMRRRYLCNKART